MQGGYDTAQALPSGWTRSFDAASGVYYYVNERTGESQWEPPSPQRLCFGFGSPLVLVAVTTVLGMTRTGSARRGLGMARRIPIN